MVEIVGFREKFVDLGWVGATLPTGARVHLVTLNGNPAAYTVRDTNAGRQVLVSTPCGGGQTWNVHIVAG